MGGDFRPFIYTILLVLFVVSAVKHVYSSPRIVLGKAISITSQSAGNTVELMWAYAHPTDGRHLMACGMIAAPQDNVMAGYVYSSDDAGVTWQRTMLENSTRFVSEENCLYGKGSRAYFVAGASNFFNGIPHHESGHLRVYVSNDYGDTWRHMYTRPQGWMDWTYLAEIPSAKNVPETLVIFANAATESLGHWYALRPVVITSSDGERSFSRLIAPRNGRRWHTLGATATGGVVLSDGTALFPAAENLFAYSPRDRMLKLRSIIDRNEKASGETSLARDQSGRLNGRLYAAWVVMGRNNGKEGDSYLRLAISNDDGFHWVTRVLLKSIDIQSPLLCRKAVFDEVHLAVNHDGTLGILWAENKRTLLFASSRDGGRTFSRSVIVAAYTRPSDMRIMEILPTDDYWQSYVLAGETGKHFTFARNTSPGLAVVMESGGLESSANALVADAHGAFHAFWSAPREDGGGSALFTRSIDAFAIKSKRYSMLHDSFTPISCALLSDKLVRPALPAPAQVLLTPPGQSEITSSIAMNPLRYHYDASSHVISVDTELVNVGKTILKGPLMLVGTNLHSDFGNPVALNAQRNAAEQPVWYADHILPTNGLAPGAHSQAMRFAFLVRRFRVPPSLYYDTGDGVAMKIRVYEHEP